MAAALQACQFALGIGPHEFHVSRSVVHLVNPGRDPPQAGTLCGFSTMMAVHNLVSPRPKLPNTDCVTRGHGSAIQRCHNGLNHIFSLEKSWIVWMCFYLVETQAFRIVAFSHGVHRLC